MQRLEQIPSSSISDDMILNAKIEGDHILQSAKQTLQVKVSSIKDPSQQAMISKKLDDLQLLVSKINEAAKQKHAEIDEKFDEMQIMLDEEIKKKKEKMIKNNSVSRTFQFGSLDWRITVRKPDHDDNGGLNESEIEELTESMEHTIAHILENHINQNIVDENVEDVDSNSNDECDLTEILQQIEEDGTAEPEPDYGYDRCNNWMCYQCEHVNPVTFEELTHLNRKCENCGSNGWPTKQEMDQIMKDTQIGEI